jgi:RNA polymerase sigma factor (sigma-70 family)
MGGAGTLWLDDGEWLPAAAARSNDWSAAYLTHRDRLVRLATVMVGPADAPDLVSDAVRKAVHSSGWSRVANTEAYLVSSLVNEVRQECRAWMRRVAREERAWRLAPRHDGCDALGDLDVRRALDALSPRQRAVVYFAYWEDRTIPEIAVLLDVSEGSVRSHLGRAKDRLKEILDV